MTHKAIMSDQKTIKAIENLVESNIKTKLNKEMNAIIAPLGNNPAIVIILGPTIYDNMIEIPYNHHIDPIPLQEIIERIQEEMLLGNLT